MSRKIGHIRFWRLTLDSPLSTFMHIFLYEWATGGGLVEEPGELPASLVREGAAMIGALAADFAKIPGYQVTALRDPRMLQLALPRCNVVDVIRALAKKGYREEAENLLNVVRLRVSGDYLQTAAVVRNGRVISAVNDPNDYGGPGTGYRLGAARRKELAAIRDVLTREEVLRTEATYGAAEGKRIAYRSLGDAAVLLDRRETSCGAPLIHTGKYGRRERSISPGRRDRLPGCG